MIAGVANALAASANTTMAPDRMPGITCGRTMRRSTVRPEAPSDTAAFSTCGSSRCSEAQTEITTKRSEEHTSELQSRSDLVCRLLLEKKKNKTYKHVHERQHIV